MWLKGENPARSMRRRLKSRSGLGPAVLGALCAFGWLGVWVAGWAEEKPQVQSVVARLQQRYDATRDFVASFRQETELKSVNRRIEAEGKVYFKRPGKMLWRYAKPEGQVILADGKRLYFYQPDQKQVIEGPLSASLRSETPLSFLLGIGDLRRDFTVVLKDSDENEYVLGLAPKGELEGVNDLILGVEREHFDILWARIEDWAGNVITVRFSDMKRGVGLPDSLFRLEVPDGVDVVELGS